MKEELKDLAWSVLPKECRKEIKFEYAFSDNKEILGDIFGHHNLTGDEEPEEMIVIPRKTITDMYAANERVISNFKDETIIYHSTVINGMLESIFFDKCLPDPSEPKPTQPSLAPYTEPKYKVGDKVTMVGEAKISYNGVGTIIEVRNNHGYAFYRIKEHFALFAEQYLAPYTEPKYKVGDKVWGMPGNCLSEIDIIGYESKAGQYHLKHFGWFKPEDILPYTEPQQTKDMEEKELNLLTLLKGCENETIYMPDEGLCKITQVLDDSITVFVKGKSWATSLKGETLEIKTTGFAYIYPSKEAFLKYPLDAYIAWMEWKSERTPKRWRAKLKEYYWRIKGNFEIACETENGLYFDDQHYDCGNYFRTKEEVDQAAEAVKRTLEEFHLKNAEK